ncbi:hypothetical protein FQA39_LY14490 [Lamprigera yunnana]|nr:hypothetical protein FQA39_LY14490 [Lamprigera yunnana]
MSDMEEKLIQCVSEHKELFDTESLSYSNTNLKKKVWEEIATELNSTSDVCKKKWRNIRDSYRKYVREVKVRIVPLRRYRHANLLQFLNPFMHDKIAITNVYTDDDQQDESRKNEQQQEKSFTQDCHNISNESEHNVYEDEEELYSQTPDTQRNRKSRMISINVPDKLKKQRIGDDSDALNQLFSSMYNTVKAFPPTLQAETKMKLFDIILKAELQFIKYGDSASLDTPSPISTSPSISVPSSTPTNTFFKEETFS